VFVFRVYFVGVFVHVLFEDCRALVISHGSNCIFVLLFLFVGFVFMVGWFWGGLLECALAMLLLLGGESQRVRDCFIGYSEKVPNATGKPISYLEPNIQTMQETRRGGPLAK